MAGRTPARSLGLWGIVVFGMNPDSPRIGKFFIFAMAGKAEGIIMVCFGQLRSTRPSMGIMAIKAKDSGLEVRAFLVINPLLMM
jgi:hypothetical protein